MTPAQHSLLELAMIGQVKRMEGGFWVHHHFIGNPRHAEHFGTSTVSACETRGWLAPCGDFPEAWRQSRRITSAGIVALLAHQAALVTSGGKKHGRHRPSARAT